MADNDSPLPAHEDEKKDKIQLEQETEEDESSLLAKYNLLKTAANSSFVISDLDAALTGYERALGVLPSSRAFEAAVVRSNMAACYVRMEEWKTCVEVCGKGMDELDAASESASKEDVQRIRTKLLLRRAKARTELGGWADLHGAQEDYTQLSKMPGLSTTDQKAVSKALVTLAPRVEEAKTKEMGEMMGKLKELGNGILKPFGLSTDSFNMVKDEKTGGYSLSLGGNGD